MSDKNKNGEQASGPSGQSDSSAPKKRRQWLPVLAALSLDDALAANENHPLAKSAPEIRAAGRLRLIAIVLARLATSRPGAA